MEHRTTVNGVPTWYDERGEGPLLVLLHGGFSDARDFDGNLATLEDRFRLILPERRGHGHTPDVPGPITMELMARDTAALIEDVAGGKAHLAGYSAGAAVALHVAVTRPDLVGKLVLISGAFDWSGMILRPEPGAVPPPPLVARYAEVSPDGPEHLSVVMDKVVRAVEEEPPLTRTDLAKIPCPTLVIAGDDDMVTLDHTLELYRGIADSQLAIVPNASHLLLLERPDLVTSLVGDFLAGDPQPTMWPIRRRA